MAVVTVHRVDCLGELGAARLVDAARIRPAPFVPVLLSDDAEVLDLVAGEVTGIRVDPTLLGWFSDFRSASRTVATDG